MLFYRLSPEIFNLSLMKINVFKTTLILIYVLNLKNAFVAFPTSFLVRLRFDFVYFVCCVSITNKEIKRWCGYTWHGGCLIWQKRHNYQIKVTIGYFLSTHLFLNARTLNNAIDHEQLEMFKWDGSLLDLRPTD